MMNNNSTDNIIKTCACRGKRTCLLCESNTCSSSSSSSSTSYEQSLADDDSNVWVLCPTCGIVYMNVEEASRWVVDMNAECSRHVLIESSKKAPEFTGVDIINEYVDSTTEEMLLRYVDDEPWVVSQEGRRKQDFGPRINFKKKRVRLAGYKALPHYTDDVREKFKSIHILDEFLTVEQCNLEYDPERGSAIVPHVDDLWVWGKRLVTLSLLAGTFLTFERILTKEEIASGVKVDYVLAPMARRSLIVVYGPARFDWKHSVRREHIVTRRICCTFRELEDDFLCGGNQYELGAKMLKLAEGRIEPEPHYNQFVA